MQSWGTELLPRLGQFADATRRVAARNAAAARMTQHVEQQWPRSSRHADEMSSVGSLSSVSTSTSSASVNTMYTRPSQHLHVLAAIILGAGRLFLLRARVEALVAPPLPSVPLILCSKIPILIFWMLRRPSSRSMRPYHLLLGVEEVLSVLASVLQHLCPWDKGQLSHSRVAHFTLGALSPRPTALVLVLYR